MEEYISIKKLKKKKVYSFQTVSGAFPKNEWFYKYDDVHSIPNADVRENIHGHWEEDSKEGFHHCSKCGQIIFSCQKWFKCCPKCMAVMDEKPFKNCHKTKCEACIYHGHCERENMREPIGEKGEK